MPKTIGILGGMGPEATADFYVKVIRRTPAQSDRDHLHVIIDADPQIPDRTAFITGKGLSPAPTLVRVAKNLVQAGADFITIPCITAHHFIDEIRAAVEVPVLSAVELSARYVAETFAEGDALAILSTSGTLRMKLFQNAMPGRTFVLPTADEQDEVVTQAIYGECGVKAVGVDAETLAWMTDYVNELSTRGARGVIAGCTEFSVLFADATLPIPLVDPMRLLADEAVRLAMEKP